MTMKNRWLFIVAGIVFVFACTHQISNPGNGNNGGGTGGSGNGGGGGGGGNGGDSLVCFEEEILPLFQSNCAKSGCHDAASHKEGYVLDSYDHIMRNGIDPGNANGSKLYQVLSNQKGGEEDDEIMPPPPNQPLSQAQIDLIGQWINEGAQNTTNCSNHCDISLFTYTGAVRPILDLHCIGCHNNTTQNGGVNLATYTGVQTVALNGKLAGAITGASGYPQMPPGGQKLSDCNITQITEWINAGAPNN
jgi:hypothetical protein